MFKYYNKDVHTASFVIPTKARAEIWEHKAQEGKEATVPQAEAENLG